jgi:hypothetical protein
VELVHHRRQIGDLLLQVAHALDYEPNPRPSS